MKTLVWDIETAPGTAFVWGMHKQNIGVSQLIERPRVISFAYRWHGQKGRTEFVSEYHDGTQTLLDTAHALLDEADAVVSWNGPSFDTKHLNREFLLAGYTEPAPFAEVDLLRIAKKRFRFISNKLDNVAHEVLGERKVEHEGFALWLRCLGFLGEAEQKKGWERMRRYNIGDVDLTDRLYTRLAPWSTTHPNVNLYDDLGGRACPVCGGENLQRRGHRMTTTGRYPRFQCTDCGKWSSTGNREGGTDVR